MRVFAACSEAYPVWFLSEPSDDDHQGFRKGYIDLPDDLVQRHRQATDEWHKSNFEVDDAIRAINGGRFK